MDSILYIYISWIAQDIWMIYIKFEKESPNFKLLSPERSPIAQPCSSVSWEQNGYYATQEFLRVSEENVRRIQESFERSPRKSTRSASRNLEYRNQLSGVCWGALYSSIESIFLNNSAAKKV